MFYDRMTVYGADPCAQARTFLSAGAKYLHVIDLDGAKDGTLSNYDTIAALAEQGGLFIEVGGGKGERAYHRQRRRGQKRGFSGAVPPQRHRCGAGGRHFPPETADHPQLKRVPE